MVYYIYRVLITKADKTYVFGMYAKNTSNKD